MVLVLLLVVFECMDTLNIFRRRPAGDKETLRENRKKREGRETFSLNGDNMVYLFLLTVENRVKGYGKDAGHNDSVFEEHAKFCW